VNVGLSAIRETQVTYTSTRASLRKLAGETTTLLEAIPDPEFVTIAIFCDIGFLLTLDVMLQCPVLTAFAVWPLAAYQ